MADKKVRFFPVYNEDMIWSDHGLVKVGEVKYDPFRKEKRWTALSSEGYRIKDCNSRLRAEEEVKDEFLLRPRYHQTADELVDSIKRKRCSNTGEVVEAILGEE
jgi:hypothetical protein